MIKKITQRIYSAAAVCLRVIVVLAISAFILAIALVIASISAAATIVATIVFHFWGVNADPIPQTRSLRCGGRPGG